MARELSRHRRSPEIDDRRPVRDGAWTDLLDTMHRWSGHGAPLGVVVAMVVLDFGVELDATTVSKLLTGFDDARPR